MSEYGQDEFDQDEMDRGRDWQDLEEYERDRVGANPSDRYDVSHHAAEDFHRQFPEGDE